MKKIFGLIAVLIVAMMPTALADHDTTVHLDTSVDATVNTSVADARLTTTASVDAEANMTPRERMKDRMRSGGSAVQPVRAVVRNATIATRAVVIAERAEIRALADGLKTCKGRRTADCDQKRTEAKVEVKASLISAADEVLKLLETTKARVGESDLASKAEITAELDTHIAAVTDAKAKAEALTNTSTRAEIKEASTTLRTAINDARLALRVGTHVAVAARFGGVLKQTEQLETRLTNALAKMEAQGKDVSSVDMTEFSAKLDLAAKLHGEAADLYVQAKTSKDHELMQQATQKMREAHAALKEAHKELREILRALKNLEGSVNVNASTTVTTDANVSVA